MIDTENKKIGFFDIIKLIHPDHNPNIENPEVKITEIVKNKEDEKTLYKFAIKWGIIEDDSIEKIDINYTIDRGKLVKVDQKYEGIIIDFEKKGDLVNIYVWIEKSFKLFKRKSIEDQDENFYIIGYAPNEKYIDLDLEFQMRYGKRQDG